MWIERLDASHALAYRELMLEAYDRHPQAFTSSVRERAVMPLSWWEGRLTSKLDAVFGAFEDGRLAGIVGLAFEPREKARHKVTLFGMYVTAKVRQRGLGYQLVQAALTEATPKMAPVERSKPPPMITSVEARAAPNLPSPLATGLSDDTIQPGSSGE